MRTPKKELTISTLDRMAIGAGVHAAVRSRTAAQQARLARNARLQHAIKFAVQRATLGLCVLAFAWTSSAQADTAAILRTTTVTTIAASTPAAANAALGATFTLDYGSGVLNDSAAKAAFDRAAARWSSYLHNAADIHIAVDYAALDTGVLGSTSVTSFQYTGYDDVRDQLIASSNGDSRESILTRLPTQSQLRLTLPAGFTADTNKVYFTSATYRAWGYDPSEVAGYANDGSITFSNQVTWDFDRSDGIAAGAFDFEGAAIHEIGHVLGFTSYVDWAGSYIAANATDSAAAPTVMDLFRFSTSDAESSTFDFTTAARMLAPGGDQSLVLGDRIVPMSTGGLGDGSQASHWKDDLGLGIMDPTAAPGETLHISQNDLAMLDLIGWEIPEPATAAILTIGAAFLIRKKRVQQ